MYRSVMVRFCLRECHSGTRRNGAREAEDAARVAKKRARRKARSRAHERIGVTFALSLITTYFLTPSPAHVVLGRFLG